MTILERMKQFADQFGKKVTVNNRTWHYYRLGAGAPIFWLTGGGCAGQRSVSASLKGLPHAIRSSLRTIHRCGR